MCGAVRVCVRASRAAALPGDSWIVAGFSTPNSQILVGHSHYFRELFRHFAAPGCTLTDGAGAALPTDDMGSKKLSNAGVARCVCDFGADGGAKPIVEVQLLFETQLVD